MEEYKLLLTTSGLGTRLGELTKFSNKSLIRIGKKPVISYIIEKYPIEIEIVVTLGHYGDQVKNFLELAYPDRKFRFIDVKLYKGEGSSLLYSMLCAKDTLQCPFVFHVCDTLTSDNIPLPTTNWCAGIRLDEKRSQYRTQNVINNKLVKINEKGGAHFDRVHIGICGIKDYQAFWNVAQTLCNSDPTNSQWSDCHVINELISNDISIDAILFNSWMDTGNIEMLEKARNEIHDKMHVLDKVDESIYIFDDSVVKFFYNDTTVQNRLVRAKHLGEMVPEIVGVRKNFYKYKYAKGVPLSTTINPIKFEKLLNWSTINLWKPLGESMDAYNRCKEFYFDKTRSRISKFLTSTNINDEECIINGIKIPPVLDVIDSIPIEYLCTAQMYNFHGDFILENIIYSDEGFVLIDWRQDFGGSLEGGDIYYDLSKLNHNLIFNHEIINKGLFEIENDGKEVKCDILRSSVMVDCQKVLKNFMNQNKFSTDKVDVLTPIIWLNMSPLHEYPISTFLFFFGRYHLTKALNSLA